MTTEHNDGISTPLTVANLKEWFTGTEATGFRRFASVHGGETGDRTIFGTVTSVDGSVWRSRVYVLGVLVYDSWDEVDTPSAWNGLHHQLRNCLAEMSAACGLCPADGEDYAAAIARIREEHKRTLGGIAFHNVATGTTEVRR